MATTPTEPTEAAVTRLAVDAIRVAENVRALDQAHVEALAGSIALQGLIVPLVVRPATDTDGFELVAGFHRLAAACSLGLAEVPVVIRDAVSEDADRAVENIARKALDAREEAQAVRAMLARGLSQEGAAQALGWSPQRVAARVKLLELPERAQQLVGDGVIALSAVEQLRVIGRVSGPLLDALIAYLDDGNAWAAERLSREPGWVLDAALRATDAKVFAAHLTSISANAIAELRLGKKAEARYEQASALRKQLDRYAYGGPDVRFTEADVDQARAAGVLIEFDNARPIITDRSLYRELTKTAIARTLDELRARADTAAAEKHQARLARRERPTDPVQVAARERDATLRELADRGHGANLDLGQALLDKLSVVDPSDLQVARFFVYALLGPDWDSSPYTQTGERVQRLAASGVRLVISELRRDVTKTRQDGTPGRLRVDYGDARQPEAAVAWLWRYLDGAKTAGELYGRALVVIAAEHYASRLVLPAGQRTPATRWGSRKDHAARALKRLAGRQLPASLKQLERAVTQAHADYDHATRPQPATPDPATPPETTPVGNAAEPTHDPDAPGNPDAPDAEDEPSAPPPSSDAA